jgi:hypothetical protein
VRGAIFEPAPGWFLITTEVIAQVDQAGWADRIFLIF